MTDKSEQVAEAFIYASGILDEVSENTRYQAKAASASISLFIDNRKSSLQDEVAQEVLLALKSLIDDTVLAELLALASRIDALGEKVALIPGVQKVLVSNGND